MQSVAGKVVEASSSGGRSRRTLQFILIVIGATIAAYSRFIVSPLQETIRQSMALNDNQIAFIQGPALALPMVLGAVPLGLLIDRHSRASLLMIFAFID